MIYWLKYYLEKKQPFALVRFGDGEKNILNDIPCQRKGFTFVPEKDQEFREQLIDSHSYMHPLYFVADDSKLSSCMLVNQNYPMFIKEIIPLFSKSKIHLVCHENSQIENLPFKVDKQYLVKNEAWKKPLDIEQFKKLKNVIFLVAAGPYSNVLIYDIWQINKKIICINVGSTLDPYLFGEKTRQYQERVFK